MWVRGEKREGERREERGRGKVEAGGGVGGRERGLWGRGGVPQRGLKRLGDLKHKPLSFPWSLLYPQAIEERGNMMVGTQ